MKRDGKQKKKSNVALGIVIALAAIVLFDLTPFGGTIRYYATWTRCGEKPVVTVGSGYYNGHTPSYHQAPTVYIFPGNQEYFCTPLEAEKAGYSASPDNYEFPHLTK